MTTTGSWLDGISLPETSLFADRKGVIIDASSSKEVIVQALPGSGKVLRSAAKASTAEGEAAETGAEPAAPPSGKAVFPTAEASFSSLAAAAGSAGNGDYAAGTSVEQAPLVSRQEPGITATAVAAAGCNTAERGDKPASRNSPEPTGGATSSEGMTITTGGGVSMVAKQSTPRARLRSNSNRRVTPNTRGTPRSRSSPKPAATAVSPGGMPVATGTRGSFSGRHPTTPLGVGNQGSWAATNDRGTPASRRSPGPAEAGVSPTDMAAPTGARAFFGTRHPTTPLGVSNKGSWAVTNARGTPASRRSPQPAEAGVSPGNIAATTGARAFFGTRHPTTPLGVSNKGSWAVTNARSTPASRRSPDPAEAGASPGNTAATTGARAFFGARYPTTPAGVRNDEIWTAKHIRNTTTGTTSPGPAEATMSPGGMTEGHGQRMSLVARQPAEGIRLRTKNGRGVINYERKLASPRVLQPTPAATSPMSMPIGTGQLNSFVESQPAVGTGLDNDSSGEAMKDIRATARCCTQASEVSGTKPVSAIAVTEVGVPSGQFSQLLTSSEKELVPAAASASPGRSATPGAAQDSAVVPCTKHALIAAATCEDVPLVDYGIAPREAVSSVSGGGPSKNEGVEAAPVRGLTRHHPVAQDNARTKFAPSPILSTAEYMWAQFQQLNTLQRIALLNPC